MSVYFFFLATLWDLEHTIQSYQTLARCSRKLKLHNPRLVKERTRTYTDFAANLRSLWNMVPPVHPTTAVQYVSGSVQTKSTRR
jgi:hypothetical protein